MQLSIPAFRRELEISPEKMILCEASELARSHKIVGPSFFNGRCRWGGWRRGYLRGKWEMVDRLIDLI